MDIRQLKYFLVLSEALHFHRAAEQLHIAQPALSQQVRSLERELKVELFSRNTRKVELTPAGRVLQLQARQILASVETTKGLVARVATGVSGRLAVGFTGSATYDLLPVIAKAVAESLPDVSLEVHGELATNEQLEALRSHAIDVGFIRPPVGPEFSIQSVRTDNLSLLLPEDHPLSAKDAVDLRDAVGESFIQYRQEVDPATDYFVAGAYQQAGFQPHVRQEVTTTSVMVSLVASGLGLALVPDSVHSVQVRGAVLRPLRHPVVPMALAAAWRRDNELPVVPRFLNLLGTLFPDQGPRAPLE